MLHRHLDLEDLGVGVGPLLSDVGHRDHLAGEFLGGVRIEREHDRLPDRYLSHVDFVDVGDRLHLRKIGKRGDAGLPRVHLRPCRLLLPVPLLDIDDHSRRRRTNGESFHDRLHHAEAVLLAVQVGAYFAHLGLRLLRFRLVVDLGLCQGAGRLLVVDLGLALDGGCFVDRLFLGQALLLHHQLHIAHLLARFGEIEGRVQHGLLGHRLGLL